MKILAGHAAKEQRRNGVVPTKGLLKDNAEHPGYTSPQQNSQQHMPAHDSYGRDMNSNVILIVV